MTILTLLLLVILKSYLFDKPNKLATHVYVILYMALTFILIPINSLDLSFGGEAVALILNGTNVTEFIYSAIFLLILDIYLKVFTGNRTIGIEAFISLLLASAFHSKELLIISLLLIFIFSKNLSLLLRVGLIAISITFKTLESVTHLAHALALVAIVLMGLELLRGRIKNFTDFNIQILGIGLILSQLVSFEETFYVSWAFILLVLVISCFTEKTTYSTILVRISLFVLAMISTSFFQSTITAVYPLVFLVSCTESILSWEDRLKPIKNTFSIKPNHIVAFHVLGITSIAVILFSLLVLFPFIKDQPVAIILVSFWMIFLASSSKVLFLEGLKNFKEENLKQIKWVMMMAMLLLCFKFIVRDDLIFSINKESNILLAGVLFTVLFVLSSIEFLVPQKSLKTYNVMYAVVTKGWNFRLNRRKTNPKESAPVKYRKTKIIKDILYLISRVEIEFLKKLSALTLVAIYFYFLSEGILK